MIVRLRQVEGPCADLSPHQLYRVIGIEADEYRILNDHGRPYLYAPELFEVLDDRRPSDWVREVGDDQEEYAYPPVFNEPGFFEDFFDDQEEAVTTFWRVVNERLVAA